MKTNRRISGGIYLVVDPSMKEAELLKKLEAIIDDNKVAAVQIWDHFPALADKVDLVEKICRISHQRKVPVLLNNEWQLLNRTNADGVHFDEVPEGFHEVKSGLSKKSFIGITCNNDLSVIKWAEENALDYISFCSIFPSTTSNSCELVDFETIREARKLTSMPIFLAGGIKPGNLEKLKELEFEGVAVISGIMNSEDPATVTKEYYKKLNQIKNENIDYR